MRALLDRGKPVTGAIFIILVTVLYSCSSNNDSELAIIKSLDESITSSNKMLERQTGALSHAFADKKADPATHEKAKLWEPKVLLVQQLSKELNEHIYRTKNDFIKETGYRKEELSDEISNKTKTRKFFSETGRDSALYHQLQKYATAVLETDPRVKKDLSGIIINLVKLVNDKQATPNSFAFANASPVAALAFLNNLQYVVLAIENHFMTFVNVVCTTVICDPGSGEWPIIVQNSTIVGPGEYIEVTTGIGNFGYKNVSEISIAGKKIPLNEQGVSIKKIKASGKPGNYHIPKDQLYRPGW